MTSQDVLLAQTALILDWMLEMVPAGLVIGAALFGLAKGWWLIMALINGGGRHRSDW